MKADKKQTKKVKPTPKDETPEEIVADCNLDSAVLELRISELTEALQRERADSQNVQRRAEEDKLKWSGFYKAQVIKEILPTLDAAEKALELAEEVELSKEGEGMVAVLVKLNQAMEKIGLERIKAEGEKFDEDLHEAISVDESDGEKEVITKEMQAGYKIGDEVLRHSMVAVRR